MRRGLKGKGGLRTKPADAVGYVRHDSDRSDTNVVGDNPIWSAESDALRRSPAAQSFARHVIGLDASEGVVVGVLGSWGSGKTSFINLAREEFERADVLILDFNPWMFSGAEQLVESFFIELSAQLKTRSSLSKVGEYLEDYGGAFSGLAWLPFAGPWITRGSGVAKALGKLLQSRKEGVAGRRATLEKALAGYGEANCCCTR